jgi:hypothetical protein
MSGEHESPRQDVDRRSGNSRRTLSLAPHEHAVLHVELKRLVRALSPYGVLHREALEREAKAESWQEPGFDRALQAAVDEGKIEERPLGFYALPHSDGTSGADGDDGRDAA